MNKLRDNQLRNKYLGLGLMLFLVLVLLTGCIDYKNQTKETTANSELIKEIEAIEKELEADVIATEATAKEDKFIEEEVVLPELAETSTTEGVSASTSEHKKELQQVITIKETQKLTLKPTVKDPDQDKVTLTYSAPLNNLGQWQTNYGDAGEYLVTITATDGQTSSSKEVKLRVEKQNVAPTIEKIIDLMIKEGETVSITPKVNDLNGDKTITTISPPLEQGLLQTNFSSAGDYPITVTVSDGELQAQQTFTLTIKNVNQKPVLTLPTELIVNEGETLTIKPKVQDLDDDQVTVTIGEPVGNDGLWDLSYIDHGEYSVTITASDGTDTVTTQVKVIVKDVNAPVEFVDIDVEIN